MSKPASKVLLRSKTNRRKWLTFIRMLRYGINNISRNAWLTIAATAVMTITLLVVFATLAARNVLITTIDEIGNKVDMSIYVKRDISSDSVNEIKSKLEKLESVRRVNFVSPEQAREEFANDNKDKQETLEALNEATNRLPGTFRVNLVDFNDITELRGFVETDKTLKDNLEPGRDPSFAGDRREAIDKIGTWVKFAEQAGLIASAVFIAISSLIVFNTIRMAIFNRKDEIQMMKLIGADQSFIRGPFVVEAVVYGVIAAVIASAMGISILHALTTPLLSYDIAVQSTIDFISRYIALVFLGMILIGSAIGVISSLLATRRYLKL